MFLLVLKLGTSPIEVQKAAPSKLNNFARLLVTAVVVDLLLVLGLLPAILAKVGVIPNVPLSATYTMIALGGAVIASQIILTYKRGKEAFSFKYDLLRAAVSSNPKAILNNDIGE